MTSPKLQANKEQAEAKSRFSAEERKRDLSNYFLKIIREAAHWFGGWDKLRKEIDRLEQEDKERAYDRAMDPDRN